MYSIEKISQCETLFNKYKQNQEEAIRSITSLLVEINEGHSEYDTLGKTKITMLHPSIDDLKTVLEDMKHRNRIENKDDEAKGIREQQMKGNKYGPDNPYPYK